MIPTRVIVQNRLLSLTLLATVALRCVEAGAAGGAMS
jgi:hypothetical protein